MRSGSAERGQATVEWVGLVLGVALALGALAGGVRGTASSESATGLGEAVAKRITCAARDGCGAPRGVARPTWRAPVRARGTVAGGRRAAGATRGAAAVEALKHSWLGCFAYRRWRYDVEKRRTPHQAVPVREAVEIVNDCVNPWSFLFG
jgi:hypothetical protein